MKEKVAEIIHKALKLQKIEISVEEIESKIGIPPSNEMGDFAFPCFFLADKLKESPVQIALNLRENIGNPPEEFEDIQTAGPYINFFVNRNNMTLNTVKEILDRKEKYGSQNIGKGKKTMIEFPSPNTNKPLHLGHLRNMSIGESVSNILEFSGEKVIKANLNNDRGIHICKSMLAYQKWGENKTPRKTQKSDHFVGDFYVLFSQKAKQNKKLEEEAQNMLVQWEQKDKHIRALWKKMNAWALKGFKETYRKYGIKHDKEYFESDLYTKGKEIIMKGVEKGIFKKEKDGSIIIDLTKEGLDKKYLLRADGTSVYITQDIYLAKLKFNDFKINKSIYVVANEQDYHFDVLFNILDKLNLLKKENLIHLSYGMVNLPEGRMKSREGTVVDADDLIHDVQTLVKKELKERSELDEDNLEKRSLKIALSAIKYFLLKVNLKKSMIFNPKESISFEGDTGPYLLYSYARAKSILRKAEKFADLNISKLENQEIDLIKKLSEFPAIVANSYNTLNPSLIANYSYQLAQTFNEFYHVCQVVGEDEESFRLSLVKAFAQVLKNSLSLLGIETIEEM